MIHQNVSLHSDPNINQPKNDYTALFHFKKKKALAYTVCAPVFLVPKSGKRLTTEVIMLLQECDPSDEASFLGL